MNSFRFIVLILILGLLPVNGYAKVYRYIDENGVERFSNQPPPAGAKIIEETGEIGHDAAADQAQQGRNQRAADAVANQPPPPPPARKATAAAVENGGDGVAPEKKYSRRKHRRKKQIRKEKAEMRKAMEALEEGKTK